MMNYLRVGEIEIRAPWAEELEVLQPLMPGAFSMKLPLQFAVAVHHPTRKVLGGWALWLPPATTADAEASYFWGVVPEFRGRPFVLPLMDALIEVARRSGAKRLRRLRVVDEGSPEAEFLRKKGFRFEEEHLCYLAPLAPVSDRVNAFYERLDKAGRIPAGVTASDLLPEYMKDVKRLVLQNNLAPEFDLANRVNESATNYDQRLSFILLQEGRAVGAFLAYARDKTIMVEVRVVDESARHVFGLNTILLKEACRRTQRVGIAEIYLRAHVHRHLETINLARRAGGKLLAHQWNCVLDLN